MRILITGATGAIGQSIVEAACNAGYHVRTLSLDPPQGDIWTDRVDIRLGDVTNQEVVQLAMEGMESVIHMAALLHITNPSQSFEEKYIKVNVKGTENVIHAAIKAGASRVVFFSTIAVYGDSNGNIIKEDSQPYPDTFYSQSKYAAERIVLDAKKFDGQPLGTVLRLGAVYGARIKGNYRRLLLALSRGSFIPLGNGKNRRTMVYDKDVAQAAALALSHPSAAGKIFNVSDGEFHTMKEIIETMCKALGRATPRFSLPAGPVRSFAGILEDGSRMLGMESPIVRNTIDKYMEDMAVDSKQIQVQLGFIPRYDLISGWRQTVEQMRRMGDL